MTVFEAVEGVPARLVAGDTWRWRRSDLAADYSPADHTLSFRGVLASLTAATWAAVAAEVDGVFEVNIAASATSGFSAGRYEWAAILTRNSDGHRVVVDRGVVIVDPDLGAATFDPRSEDEKLLAAVDATLSGRVTKDVESYTIEGRSLTKIPFVELRSLRDQLRREVNAARRRAAGKAPIETVPVRFV